MYTIEKELTETTKETYTFNIFNNKKIVLIDFTVEEKPNGKRKYTVINKWDIYQKRDNNTNEPILTEEIKNMVLNKIISQLQVLQSTEFFN